MAAEPHRDAYRILQVLPVAHPDVIRASYYALARIYHPDGDESDADLMSDLNWAYDQLRDRTRREAYDRARSAAMEGRARQTQPMGPGPGDGWQVVTPAPPPPSDTPSETAGPFARARHQSSADSMRIDFGRYAGWSIRDLVHQDPTYLRWLSRHSSGVRYRAEILRYLPAEKEDLAPLRTPTR
jgi:curved DNA-binding protein CbpA